MAFVSLLITPYQSDSSPVGEPAVSHVWSDEFRYVPSSDGFDVTSVEYTEPCYTVEIDPTLLGGIEEYRSGQLQQHTYRLDELTTDAFQLKLAERLAERTWEDANLCDKGSFVLIFQVEEDGMLGSDMLAHHIKGLNRSASLATRVLLELEAEGHRWHTGGQPAGQVQLPVRFQLN